MASPIYTAHLNGIRETLRKCSLIAMSYTLCGSFVAALKKNFDVKHVYLKTKQNGRRYLVIGASVDGIAGGKNKMIHVVGNIPFKMAENHSVPAA